MGLAMFTYRVVVPRSFEYELGHPMYVWFHTKINPIAIEEEWQPNDGVMGRVRALRPDPDAAQGWLVDVEFTAADVPERFYLQPLMSVLDDMLCLVGFSAFFKRD